MTSMNARLESAQHIIHHILTHEYQAEQTGMQFHENKIRIDVRCKTNLLNIDKDELEDKVNRIIKKNLPVIKTMYDREAVPKEIDISGIPNHVKKVRIVSIGNFDVQPCGNPHVNNTSEIGTYRILEINKKGKDVYRFVGTVDSENKVPPESKNKIELQLAKGVRDFPPEEKIIREQIISVLKETFERYGFNPFETPLLERLDTLKAKFAAGADSDAYNEIFKIKDQGDRDLGLRFELTLSLCRFIAMTPNIKLPFKRYEIGRVYRDGPIKLGRYREFWQCDVDIVGGSKVLADAEIIALAHDVFKKLGFKVEIEISNRKLLNGMLEHAGVPADLAMSAMIAIDKLKKVGRAEVKKELSERGLSEKVIAGIDEFLSLGENLQKIKKFKPAHEGAAELEEMFKYLDSIEVPYTFNHTLARGLSYYTGPIFEVFLKNSKIKSSVAGGGRYDEFIGNFLGGKRQIPATGISFGLEPITDAMKLSAKDIVKTVTQVFIIPIGTEAECLKLAHRMRQAGLNVEMDVIGRGITKNLKYADSMGIPYVVFAGEDEFKKNIVKLRNMRSGTEQEVGTDKITSELLVLFS